MNSVILTGRITKDPEVKTGKNGGSYLLFCLAVDGGKDTEGNKITDFIDCVAYKAQADFMGKYVVKGTLLEICGKLHTSSKEDSEGNKIKRTNVKVDNVGILVKPPVTSETTKEATPESETKPESFDPDYSGELPFQI